MLSINTTLERNSEMIHANIDNETILMSLTNGEYYGINNIGSKIWELLENSMSIGELIENLTTIYDITKEQCETDIVCFLTDMQEKEIIKTVSN